MLDRHPFSLSPRTVEDIVRLSSPFSNQLQDVRLGLYAHATCRISGRQAESLHRRALEGGESQLGAQHPNTLVRVNNLALVLKKQGKLAEAGLRSLGYPEVAKVSTGRYFSSGQDEGLVSFCISQSHW